MDGELAFISLTETVRNRQRPLAVSAGESFASTRGYDTVTRMHAACLSALGLAQLGRASEAVRLLDLATGLNERDRSLREWDVYSADLGDDITDSVA